MPVTYTAINLTTLQLVTLDEIDADFFGKTPYVFPPTSLVLFGAPETTFQGEANVFSITKDLGGGESIVIAFKGDWPAPLTLEQFSDINQINAWLTAAANLQIDEIEVLDSRGDGFRLDVIFDGDGPTVQELVTSWGEEDLRELLPAQPVNWEGTEIADIFEGTAADDILDGKEGRDRLKGGDGNDSIKGGEDGDFLQGGKGDDFIEGESGGDKLHGDDGDDVIYGGGGRDVIRGGLGDDTLYAADFRGDTDADDKANAIKGQKGDDWLYGGDFNDTLWGGKGKDAVFGGNGNDVIHAGRGVDALVGGAGNDVFVFTSGGITGTKTMGGFTRFGGDTFQLEGFAGLDASVMDLGLGERFDALRAAGITASNVGQVWTVDFNGEAEAIINGGSFATEEQILFLMEIL